MWGQGSLRNVSQVPLVCVFAVTKNVQVAIIRTHFEVDVFQAIPLIQNLVHGILALAQLKPDRPLVRLIPGVTLYLHSHRDSQYHIMLVSLFGVSGKLKAPEAQPAWLR